MKIHKRCKAILSVALIMSMTLGALCSQIISKAETPASKYASVERDTTITANEDGSINISRTKSEEKIMGKEDSWTFFFYMCGSNLETEYECTTNDIQEMLNANFNSDNIENLNVIIQTGGSKQWHSNRITNSHIGRYKIDADSNMLTCIERMPQKSMGDPDTLYDFLSWGVENYAAEHMAVVFWNHGGGVENGVCFDENYNDDYISVHDLEYTFAKLKNTMTSKFELIGFDTCLSGSIEYANLLTPYAKYLVASADTAPAKGWNYTPVMNHILENPDTTGDVVGKIAVENTSNFLDEFLVDKSNDYTWAYYDLSKTDKVCVELNNLSKYLYTEATTNYDEKYYDMYSLFNRCIRYNYNNIDVGSLLYAVEHNDLFNYDTSTLRAALKEFIPYSRNKNKFDSNKELIALSYYMPIHTITLNSLNTYRNIAFSPYQLNLVEFMNVANKSKDMTQFKHTDFTKSPYFFETNFDFINYDQDKDTEKEANQKTYDLLQTNSDYVADGFVQNWYDNINIPLIPKDKNLITKSASPINADTRTLQLADGQKVQAYTIGKDANCTRYSIAVMINNTPSSIRVEKITSEDGSTKLSILGAWDSTYSPYTSTKAGRGYLPLKEGSIIKPIYDVYNTANKTYTTTTGDIFTVTDINNVIVLR